MQIVTTNYVLKQKKLQLRNNQSHKVPINIPCAEHKLYVITLFYQFDKFNVYFSVVINRAQSGHS